MSDVKRYRVYEFLNGRNELEYALNELPKNEKVISISQSDPYGRVRVVTEVDFDN